MPLTSPRHILSTVYAVCAKEAHGDREQGHKLHLAAPSPDLSFFYAPFGIFGNIVLRTRKQLGLCMQPVSGNGSQRTLPLIVYVSCFGE